MYGNAGLRRATQRSNTDRPCVEANVRLRPICHSKVHLDRMAAFLHLFTYEDDALRYHIENKNIHYKT